MDCNHRFQVSLIIVSLLLITTFFMQHFGQFSKVSTMMVESATAEVSNITIEFPPGFAIKNGTGQAIITGFQKCSEQTGFMSDLRGRSPNKGKESCVVIDKDTQTIRAQIHTSQDGNYETSVETWRVVRTLDRISITRPNGEFVVPLGS
ncbi:UNVERIFIED_ORG: hypothetical protein M2414_004770 [Rahnella aquatilis]